MTVARSSILLVGPSMGPLVELSLQVDALAYRLVIAPAPRPLDYLLEFGPPQPEGIIVRLFGSENVADLRRVCEAFPESAVVFLCGRFPPSPAAARIVAASGNMFLSASESSIAVVASLVSLMYQREVAELDLA
jgi:hypothetical protein